MSFPNCSLNIIPPQTVAAVEMRITKTVALSGTLPTDSQNSSSREKVRVVERVKPRIKRFDGDRSNLVISVIRNRVPVKINVEAR